MPQRQPLKATRALVLVAICLMAFVAAGGVMAQSGPPPEVRAAIRSVEDMLAATDSQSLQSFAESRLASDYRQTFDQAQLLVHLEQLRAAARYALGDARLNCAATACIWSSRLSGVRNIC